MSSSAQYNVDLAALGARQVAVSLGFTLYFKAPLAEFGAEIVRLWSEFVDASRDHLRWYSDTTLGRFDKAGDAAWRRPAVLLADPSLQGAYYSWIAHGGERRDSVSPFLFEAGNTARANRLNYVRVTYPIDIFSADFSRFVKQVLDWSDVLPVFHGYGGLAFNESPVTHVRQAESSLIYRLAFRYPGVEVDNPFLTTRSAASGIKGVNWLTVVGDELLEQLSAFANVESELAEPILLHRFHGGIMIQAGDKPRLVDGDLGDYREVARVLKPIRIKEHLPLGPEELGSFGFQGTTAWLNRFDD